MVSTVGSKQEGPKIACASFSLRGFPPVAPISSQGKKTFSVDVIGLDQGADLRTKLVPGFWTMSAHCSYSKMDQTQRMNFAACINNLIFQDVDFCWFKHLKEDVDEGKF